MFPTLTVSGGNNQTWITGEFLPLPLVVTATGTSGAPISGVSVTFAVTSGSGALASSNTGAPINSTLVARTGANGMASVYVFLPITTGTGAVQISATSTGYPAGGTIFNAQSAPNYNDDDGDGYPNIYEYVNGSDYHDAGSIPPPTLVVSGSGGDYTSIQDAIDDTTQDYQIISVQPGTYTENLTIGAHKILLISASGAATTIIDGGASGSVITLQNDSIVHGFTIRNGAADGGGQEGGGIWVQSGAPRITNCVITSNESPNGGAIANDNGTPTFLHCTICYNSTGGGAITSGTSLATFINSVLWDPVSSAEISGTAVFTSYCDIHGTSSDPTSISVDPLVTEDGHLMVSGSMASGQIAGLTYSPCIGRGGSVPNIPLHDMDGETRYHWTPGSAPLATKPDIGADQFTVSPGAILPDWWVLSNFGHLGISGTADSDGDGVPNFEEYLEGTNPTIVDSVVPPNANYASGSHASPIFVTLSTPTQGAVIRYTTDGSQPNSTSPIFDPAHPIPIASSSKLNAESVLPAQSGQPALPPSKVSSFQYYSLGRVEFKRSTCERIANGDAGLHLAKLFQSSRI